MFCYLKMYPTKCNNHTVTNIACQLYCVIFLHCKMASYIIQKVKQAVMKVHCLVIAKVSLSVLLVMGDT